MGSHNINNSAGAVATSINGAPVSAGAINTSGAIATNGTLGVRVLATITYAVGTVNEGAKLYILRRTRTGGWQQVADAPFNIEFPKASGSTYDLSYFVDARTTAEFKVAVGNSVNTGLASAYVATENVYGITG